MAVVVVFQMSRVPCTAASIWARLQVFSEANRCQKVACARRAATAGQPRVTSEQQCAAVNAVMKNNERGGSHLLRPFCLVKGRAMYEPEPTPALLNSKATTHSNTGMSASGRPSGPPSKKMPMLSTSTSGGVTPAAKAHASASSPACSVNTKWGEMRMAQREQHIFMGM